MSTKFLTAINLVQNSLLNAVMHPSAGAPGSPVAGQAYYDTALGMFGVYDGNTSTWLYLGGSSGTVTSVSVVSANGLAGTVATATTTPAITLSTSVTGLLKGNGTAISAATSGTDYAPATSGTSILKGSGSGGFSNAVANTDYAPVNSPTFTGTVTVPATVNATDAASKSYVDGVAQGLDAKPSVKALGASNLTLSGTQTIDGYAASAGDRVLATGQSTASQNGIWVVASGAWARPSDFASASVQSGTYVFVEGGTAYGSSGWVLSGTAAVTVDTTAQTWTQFSGAGEITANNGVAKSGNTISIENSGVLTVTHGGTGGSTVALAKASLGFGSVYNSGAIGDGSSTSLTVTHSLGNAIPVVQVYDVSGASPVQVLCDVTATNSNTVTLGFGTAPASSSIKCVVMG